MSADRDNADVAKMIAAAASRHAADPAGDAHAGEGHVHSAWRTWLSALATDAEAAMAAALAYESLAPEARDAWLDALDADAPTLDVPRVALFAPLRAVESDAGRRARIDARIASDPHARPAGYGSAQALRGVAPDGTHACVIVAALYLDFVQVIACRYTPAGGFVTVRHDPGQGFSPCDATIAVGTSRDNEEPWGPPALQSSFPFTRGRVAWTMLRDAVDRAFDEYERRFGRDTSPAPVLELEDERL